jgi:PAS domain S-box-containing protein
MDGVSRHSWFRSARSPGVPLIALIVLLGVGGYVLTSATIRHDRDEAAERRAQVEIVHTQEVLGRARAYVAGLADVLAREPEPGQARFARWAGATSASVGLNDVLWIERVPAAERSRYERRRGVSIRRLTASGRLIPAPAARSYLPATFTSQTRPELRRGVDVMTFPGLATAIGDPARIFAVGASSRGALGGERGFYLLEAANFAGGRHGGGYLAAFVPRGWFSTTLGGDPRRVAISEDGRRIEGQLDSVSASAGFETLGRTWRIDVGREPPSGLQSTLPWLALLWPLAIAGIVLAIGRAITQRRRAQRYAERIFELSRDMLGIVGFDGRYRAVNPAFHRTLGYSREEMLARPFADFLHPDDMEASGEAFGALVRGGEISLLENRFLCADGSERWLQWTAQGVPGEGVVYGIARDVTEARRINAEQAALRRVATLVAQAVPLSEVFSAVTQEAGMLLDGDFSGLARFDGKEVVAVAAWAADGPHPPVPPSWPMQDGDPATTIAETREPSRWDDWTEVPGPIAAFIREMGVRTSVGCPIVVEGELWGALAVHSKGDALPEEAESRITQFNDLVAVAIANAQARGEVDRLAREQAALRRVATLVAENAPQAEVFAGIAESVAELFGTDDISMSRFEGGSRLIVATSGRWRTVFPVGSRQPLGGVNAASRVFETRKPVRIDDYRTASGPIADLARTIRAHPVVSTPIIVDGRLWGAMTIGAAADSPLPPETERRLEEFTELMATAVANTESRAKADRLTEEQAALRRVATLVAGGGSRQQVFNAIAEEMRQLIGTDFIDLLRYEDDRTAVSVASGGTAQDAFAVGSRHELGGDNATSRILRTRQSVRIDDYDRTATGPIADSARTTGIRSAVGTPIVVGDRLWGAVTIGTTGDEPLPPDTESRLGQFAELMSTAIANTESRAEVERLAEEQAALRRVATLVAEGVEHAELSAAVAREIGQLLAVDHCYVTRFDADNSVTVLAGWLASGEPMPVALPRRYGPGPMSEQMRESGRPARLDPYPGDPGAGELEEGVRSAVAAPITVEGRLWGFVTVAAMRGEPPPPDTEARLNAFTELVATAIANAESREDLSELADEQAALRRVATLAAERAPPSTVLDAVAGEMEALLGADQVALNRFEPGDEIMVLAHRGLDVERTPVGSRMSVEGESATAMVRRTGKPARMEAYESAEGPIAELARTTGLRSSVSAPITVEGRLWGVLTASWKSMDSPPADTEERIVKFAALLDTAIANAAARTEIERLAEEQAALRRVATLVAEGAPATAVFDAVAAEMARLLEADGVTLSRFEPDEQVTVVAHRGLNATRVPPGTRVRHTGENVTSIVRRTKRPARMEHYEAGPGAIAELVRDLGVRASVAAPIVVDGQLWGLTIANWQGAQSPPADTEDRMTKFAGLLDTAIANADSRDQLTASRARLVTAGDEARRQVVRDLHDGAQQRLVHTIVTLKLAKRAFGEGDGKAEALVGEALQHAERGNAELRELAHGLLPTVLTRGGLRAGVDAVVSRLDLPVRIDVSGERFPSEIEASAYFIVAEALTNVMKHSHATCAEVRASAQDGVVHVEVQDDGIGGADPAGHGLVGMADRVTALGGRLTVESTRGRGTLVAATLPLSGT